MIPHNRYTASLEDRAAADRVLQRGHVGQGEEVQAFERELEERFGRPAAVVSSGTAALYLALRVSGVWEGDSVLIPTYACTALYHAARMTGASVQLADILPESFNLDPGFKARHKSKATVYVHTYGVPGQVPTEGVVVSDVTHALGASFIGTPVTMMGDLAVASLGPTKLLATPGAGVVFGSEDRIAEIRDRRDYDGKDTLRERFNFQSNDVVAAMGRVRLSRLDADLLRREHIALNYGSVRPRRIGLQYEDARLYGACPRTWYRYVLRVRDPGSTVPWRKAKQRFADAGVDTINPLEPRELLHKQTGEDRLRFPSAMAAAHYSLSLPIYPELTDEEVSRVCDVLSSLEA